jgi:hypothetical protein
LRGSSSAERAASEMPCMSLPDCEIRCGCFFCLPRPRGLSLKSTVSGSTTLMVEVESSSRAGPPSWPRIRPWPRHSSVLRSSWSSFTIIFRVQGAPGAGRRAHHDDKQGRAPVLAEEPESGEARWRCGLRRRLSADRQKDVCATAPEARRPTPQQRKNGTVRVNSPEPFQCTWMSGT